MMKKMMIGLLVAGSINSFAQVAFKAVLKDSDVPKLKCSDAIGGYYIFYNLKKLDSRGPFVVAYQIPKEGTLDVGYEMVTLKNSLNNSAKISFTVNDPVALAQGQEKIYDIKIVIPDKKLTLFARGTGKTYEMNCTIPVKDVDYN